MSQRSGLGRPPQRKPRPITGRQRIVLQFIAEYTTAHAYPPTVRDIGYRLAITSNAVNDHLLALVKKGFLTRAPKAARGIAITPDGYTQLSGIRDGQRRAR